MKNKLFKFTGAIAVAAFMLASFFMSGNVQSSDGRIGATLQSINANAGPEGCEGAGACILGGIHYDFAPVP